MTGIEDLPRPRWLVPAVAVTAIVVGLLAWVDFCTCSADGWQGRMIAVGVVLVAWFVELAGLRWPRPVFSLAATLPIAYLVSTRQAAAAPLFLLMAVAWATYTGRRAESLLGGALALAVLLPAWAEPDTWVPWSVGLLFSGLGAYAIATQQRLLLELRVAQADLGRRAEMAERQRIAREIHDVIAHSLTITLLHLKGARHVLSRDPRRAAEALAQAEQLGRESLADVRRTIGLLGAGGVTGTAAPLPGAGDIAALVADYSQAGMDVAFVCRGDPAALPPATGLAIYRITQEALANVAKHAPGTRASVDLVMDHGLALRVRNAGPRHHGAPIGSAGGGGLGIAGMRERAALAGGTLTVGSDGGGWSVEFVIPVLPKIDGRSSAPPGPPAPVA